MKTMFRDFEGFVKVIFITLECIVLMISACAAYELYLNGALFHYIELNGSVFVIVGVVVAGNLISSWSKLTKISKLKKDISLKSKEIDELKNLIKKEEA